jgi:predicted MPP superfamily phosphohydrolase
LILATFLLFHWVGFVSVVKFFSIQAPLAKKITIGIFIFLGGSFFLSTALSHWQDNVATRAYYFFSGSWVGFLINLVMFFAVAWGVVWLASIRNIVLNNKYIGIVVIFLAAAYSAYGIWNSFNPIIKRVDVSINNLPKEWIGKKVIQISDVHLGHIYRQGYVENLVSKINSTNPDVVVITGDLFDGTDGNLETFVEPLRKIQAPEGVYFITGNHETYLGIDNTYKIIAQTDIVPLRDSLKNINGLQFIGIDYPLRGADRDISKIIPAMPGYDPNTPSILLIHEPLQIKAAKKLGIALQLSGHTHKGQLFPFGFVTSLVYGGYDYGFKREGSFAIYTTSGLGGWGPPMRTEKRAEIVELILH